MVLNMKSKMVLYAITIGVIIEFGINNKYVYEFQYPSYYAFSTYAYALLGLVCLMLFSVRSSHLISLLFVTSVFTSALNYFMINPDNFNIIYEFRWGGYLNWSCFYRVVEIAIISKVVFDAVTGTIRHSNPNGIGLGLSNSSKINNGKL